METTALIQHLAQVDPQAIPVACAALLQHPGVNADGALSAASCVKTIVQALRPALQRSDWATSTQLQQAAVVLVAATQDEDARTVQVADVVDVLQLLAIVGTQDVASAEQAVADADTTAAGDDHDSIASADTDTGAPAYEDQAPASPVLRSVRDATPHGQSFRAVIRATLEPLRAQTGLNQVPVLDLWRAIRAAVHDAGKTSLGQAEFVNVMCTAIDQAAAKAGRQAPGAANCRRQLVALFNFFDLDKSGTVELPEAAAVLSMLASGTQEQRLEVAFECADADGDDSIDQAEMQAYFMAVFSLLGATTPGLVAALAQDDTSLEQLAEATAAVCFQEADVNKDGLVSRDEFIAWASSGAEAAAMFRPSPASPTTETVGFASSSGPPARWRSSSDSAAAGPGTQGKPSLARGTSMADLLHLPSVADFARALGLQGVHPLHAAQSALRLAAARIMPAMDVDTAVALVKQLSGAKATPGSLTLARAFMVQLCAGSDALPTELCTLALAVLAAAAAGVSARSGPLLAAVIGSVYGSRHDDGLSAAEALVAVRQTLDVLEAVADEDEFAAALPAAWTGASEPSTLAAAQLVALAREVLPAETPATGLRVPVDVIAAWWDGATLDQAAPAEPIRPADSPISESKQPASAQPQAAGQQLGVSLAALRQALGLTNRTAEEVLAVCATHADDAGQLSPKGMAAIASLLQPNSNARASSALLRKVATALGADDEGQLEFPALAASFACLCNGPVEQKLAALVLLADVEDSSVIRAGDVRAFMRALLALACGVTDAAKWLPAAMRKAGPDAAALALTQSLLASKDTSGPVVTLLQWYTWLHDDSNALASVVLGLLTEQGQPKQQQQQQQQSPASARGGASSATSRPEVDVSGVQLSDVQTATGLDRVPLKAALAASVRVLRDLAAERGTLGGGVPYVGFERLLLAWAPAEHASAVREGYAPVLFRALDVHGKGSISVQEMVAGLAVLCGHGTSASVAAALAVYADDEHRLGLDGLVAFLRPVFRLLNVLEIQRNPVAKVHQLAQARAMELWQSMGKASSQRVPLQLVADVLMQDEGLQISPSPAAESAASGARATGAPALASPRRGGPLVPVPQSPAPRGRRYFRDMHKLPPWMLAAEVARLLNAADGAAVPAVRLVHLHADPLTGTLTREQWVTAVQAMAAAARVTPEALDGAADGEDPALHAQHIDAVVAALWDRLASARPAKASALPVQVLGALVAGLQEARTDYAAGVALATAVALVQLLAGAGLGATSAAWHAAREAEEDEEGLLPPGAVRSMADALGLQHIQVHDMVEHFAAACDDEAQLSRQDFEAALLGVARDAGHGTSAELPAIRALAAALFDAFDVDGSGVVDYTELMTGLAALCGGSSPAERADLIADLYDVDTDAGMLPSDAVATAVASLLRVGMAHPGAAAQAALALHQSLSGDASAALKHAVEHTADVVTAALQCGLAPVREAGEVADDSPVARGAFQAWLAAVLSGGAAVAPPAPSAPADTEVDVASAAVPPVQPVHAPLPPAHAKPEVDGPPGSPPAPPSAGPAPVPHGSQAPGKAVGASDRDHALYGAPSAQQAAEELPEPRVLQEKLGIVNISPADVMSVLRSHAQELNFDGTAVAVLQRPAFKAAWRLLGKLGGVHHGSVSAPSDQLLSGSSGRYSEDEVEAVEQYESLLEQLFLAFDTDGDGMVDFVELVAGLSQLLAGTPSEKIAMAFAAYDEDGNGHVSADELRRFLTTYFACLLRIRPELRLALQGAAVGDVAAATAADIFHQADMNHDGMLSLDEFTAWCDSNGVTSVRGTLV